MKATWKQAGFKGCSSIGCNCRYVVVSLYAKLCRISILQKNSYDFILLILMIFYFMRCLKSIVILVFISCAQPFSYSKFDGLQHSVQWAYFQVCAHIGLQPQHHNCQIIFFCCPFTRTGKEQFKFLGVAWKRSRIYSHSIVIWFTA